MITAMHAYQRCLPAIALVLLGACARNDETNLHRITGTVSYSAPVTLDDATRLELQITDVSISDGPAETIASTVIADLRQLPYQYSLAYAPEKVDPEHRYTIEARIYSGQTLRFATDTAYEVQLQNTGNGTARTQDLKVVEVGSNIRSPVNSIVATPEGEQFAGELRTASGVSLYRAGLVAGRITWLEEQRSNNTPEPLQARYEFRGALLQHYRDGAGVEIEFDERGRPQHLQRQGKQTNLKVETDTLNAVRNRADLLRSHALATHESQSHRQATEQWQGKSGLSQFKP